MNTQFKGTGVAVITPFNKDKSIDYKSTEKLIEHLLGGGVDYLVVQGTTGESVTLSKEEKRAQIDFYIKKVNGRCPLVLGIGGNNTASVCEEFTHFDLTKVDAILSASPAYNKPSQEGIYQHYKAIAELSLKPIILYNVPGRTASNISSETTLRLARDFKNIIAIKEASNNLRQIMDIIENKPDGFLVISGDDGFTLPIMALGGDGVISVVAHGKPKAFSSMVKACLMEDYKRARQFHYQCIKLTDLIFQEGNPAGIKSALTHMGLIENHLRLPLVPVSKSLDLLIQKAV